MNTITDISDVRDFSGSTPRVIPSNPVTTTVISSPTCICYYGSCRCDRRCPCMYDSCGCCRRRNGN